MKFRFKPVHFESIPDEMTREDAADDANAALEAHEKTLPVIVITGKKKELDVRYDALPENFKAGLWGIEETK